MVLQETIVSDDRTDIEIIGQRPNTLRGRMLSPNVDQHAPGVEFVTGVMCCPELEVRRLQAAT